MLGAGCLYRYPAPEPCNKIKLAFNKKNQVLYRKKALWKEQKIFKDGCSLLLT